jgi:hypothetical protein
VFQALTSLRTETLYNPDSQPSTVCRPRQVSEGGGGGCTATSRFASHTDYDVAGRPSTVRTYRDASGPALTSTARYDADGNPISSTDPRGKISTGRFDPGPADRADPPAHRHRQQHHQLRLRPGR